MLAWDDAKHIMSLTCQLLSNLWASSVFWKMSGPEQPNQPHGTYFSYVAVAAWLTFKDPFREGPPSSSGASSLMPEALETSAASSLLSDAPVR